MLALVQARCEHATIASVRISRRISIVRPTIDNIRYNYNYYTIYGPTLEDARKEVRTLLHDHIGIEPSISNALRNGKKSDKTRLLKVSVSSTQEKSSILTKCYMLRNSSNPTSVQKIFATPDLTSLEQKKDKVLRQKLAEMNKDGKIYRIKNGKIVRRA